MRDAKLYEKNIVPDEKFPIKISRIKNKNVERNCMIFSEHWHEYLELWYLIDGAAMLSHSGKKSYLKPGDLAVANSNELHAGYSLGDSLEYMCIIIDPKTFSAELSQGSFMFENVIYANERIRHCLEEIFAEYSAQKIGFDLAVKAKLYELLTYLVRNHINRSITQEEYLSRTNRLARLAPAVEYIQNYYNTEISYAELAKMINVSKYHFCHLFKEATGKTVVQYINDIRLDKAYELLKNTDMNITQVSMSVGFNDMNYFSRIFRRKKKLAPSKVRGSAEKRNNQENERDEQIKNKK